MKNRMKLLLVGSALSLIASMSFGGCGKHPKTEVPVEEREYHYEANTPIPSFPYKVVVWSEKKWQRVTTP